MHECSSSILSIASNSGFILVRSSTDDEHVQTLAFRQFREEKATLDFGGFLNYHLKLFHSQLKNHMMSFSETLLELGSAVGAAVGDTVF